MATPSRLVYWAVGKYNLPLAIRFTFTVIRITLYDIPFLFPISYFLFANCYLLTLSSVFVKANFPGTWTDGAMLYKPR